MRRQTGDSACHVAQRDSRRQCRRDRVVERSGYAAARHRRNRGDGNVDRLGEPVGRRSRACTGVGDNDVHRARGRRTNYRSGGGAVYRKARSSPAKADADGPGKDGSGDGDSRTSCRGAGGWARCPSR